MLSSDTGLWVVFLARSFDLSLALGMASALFFCLSLLGLDHHHRGRAAIHRIGQGKDTRDTPTHYTHTTHSRGFLLLGGGCSSAEIPLFFFTYLLFETEKLAQI